jgi:hypothetical protein
MFIEQAVYASQDGSNRAFLAKSFGFLDSWLAQAERICAGFGERPAGAVCPQAVFALPLDRRHVAVVQVAEQGAGLAFRLLIVPAALYAELGGDPFRVSDQFPPDYKVRGELSALSWSAGAAPRRLVAELRRVLDVEEQRTQTLLGGVQILVDGGRLAFERPAPDEKIVRDLWALLPTSTRRALWPASFAFSNRHRFHLIVTPKADGPDFEGYVREDKAGDYPEGRYEHSLQKAVEADNQPEVDALLSRRSRTQMFWLAVLLLVGFVVAAIVLNWDRPPKESERTKQPGPDETLKLPPAETVPHLDPAKRKQLGERIGRIGKQLGMKSPAADSEAALDGALAELDRKIDEKLGEKKPRRDPGPADTLGPVSRHLRALLWKHGVKDYDSPRLDAGELLARLEARLVEEGVIKEVGGD